jgi:hypothetical protein
LQLIDSETERTTAATDALVALLALHCAWQLRRQRQRDPWKVDLWSATFAALASAGALGALAHGFTMSPRTNARLWRPLNLLLGLTVALFVVGAIRDYAGPAAGQRALRPALGVGLLFFLITQVVPGSFTVFIVYEALAMLTALALYSRLALNGKLEGAQLMVAAILISIIAAGVQASPISARLIWEFDHNGLFHLIQMAGLPLLVRGLKAGLQAASPVVIG